MQKKRNKTYFESILANPKQFKRDVFSSAPKNRQELVRNIADYNENVLLLALGGPYAKRRYPRAPRISPKKQPGILERAFRDMLGERESAFKKLESKFKRR